MYNGMQRAVAISLLFFMLLQAGGYFFVFKIQQHEIRQEIKQQIKAGMPEDELVLLKIPNALAHESRSFWSIPEREFRSNGVMYDVVRQEGHGDTTWYYCLADEKETRLFANLDEAVKRDMNQNPARQQKLERILQLLGPLYFSHPQDFPFLESAQEVKLAADCFGLKIWIDPPPTPPPEA